MKAAWYERNGAAREVLNVGVVPDPVPSPGEVRVRVHASGVNPTDVKARAGRPLGAARVIPHHDGAGVIDTVGPGVPESRIGERVWIWNGQWQRQHGTAAELIVVPAEQAVFLPANTSFEEGACLGIPAITALRAMTLDGSVLGRTVLVTGGAGAVGAYAIQFARLLGAATIITTVSSAKKAEIARRLGADHVIDYRTEDVAARVKDITLGAGIDRIVEVDAAANSRLVPKLIARDGLYVVYGSSKPEMSFEFIPMISIGAVVRYFVAYSLDAESRMRTTKALQAYLAAGQLSHAVAKTLPLDDVATAHEDVESGQVVGNVVIRPVD